MANISCLMAMLGYILLLNFLHMNGYYGTRAVKRPRGTMKSSFFIRSVSSST